MANPNHPLKPAPGVALSQLERVCDRFEAQWRDRGEADLIQFLADCEWRPTDEDQTLADELVCIDLEHRWRSDYAERETPVHDGRSLGVCPTADDYAEALYGSPGRKAPWLWVQAEWNARVAARESDALGPLYERYRGRPEISRALEDLSRDATTQGVRHTRTDSRGFKLRCPQCQQATTIVVDSDLTDVVCESCGCAFNLVDQAQETRGATTLTTLGSFELVERLGFGGFGTVWKARDTRLDRTVAVKVPRRGVLSRQETEMFLREARSAAQLRHPNIVSVHEVGVAEGSPFLVTDFIRGVALSDQLSSGERMTSQEAAILVRKLALAIHHAHEHGVIHRDIKPANVMIDDAGEPHVMDFGLAKRTVTDVAVTVEGQILGTPAYMSPEQARGDGDRADQRTDIYALGAVLFELLTGETPFRGTVQMLIKQVVDAEPPAPRSLNRSVPVDLETICLKCLEKEPGRRYPTAQALANDLGLHLDDRPITARSVGPIGRRWRWCRRNPVVATLGVAVAGLLVSVAAVASFAYLKTAETLRRQEVSARKAEEVSRFLVDLFGSADTISSAIGGDQGFFTADPASANLTARELLDRGADRIADRFGSQPEAKITLLETMSQAYASLGLYSRGADQLNLALDTARQLDNEEDVARLTHWLGTLEMLGGRYDRGKQLLDEALARRSALYGERSMEVSATMVSLGVLYTCRLDKPADAEKYLRSAISIRTQLRGPTDPSVAHAFSALAAHQLSQSDDNAKHSLVQMIGILKQSDSEDHVQFGDVIANYQLGVEALEREDYPLAVEKLEAALALGRGLLGPRHPFIAFGLFDCGRALEGCDRHDEAIEAMKSAIEIADPSVGMSHPKVLTGRRALAELYSRCGLHDDALAGIESVLEDARQIAGTESVLYAEVLGEYARVISRSGDRTRAAVSALRAIEIGERVDGADLGELRYRAAIVLRRAGRLDAAIAALGDLFAEEEPGRGSLRLLAELQLEKGDHAGVLETTDFANRLVTRQGDDDFAGWVAHYDTLRAEALAAQGHNDEARRLLTRAMLVLEAMYDDGDSWVQKARRVDARLSAESAEGSAAVETTRAQGKSSKPSAPATVEAAR